MSDIVGRLDAVLGLRGDTFSSAEVLGILAAAKAEIERLTRRLSLTEKSIEYFEADRIEFEATIDRLKAALREIVDVEPGNVYGQEGAIARAALEGKP